MEAQANEKLRRAREERGWTLSYVAEAIECPDPRLVGKWERGVAFPLRYRKKLCEVFNKSAEELGLIKERKPLAQPVSDDSCQDAEDVTGLSTNTIPDEKSSIWTIPLLRNPFFTGQEVLLTRLAEMLLSEQSAALSQQQAISGMGGIGKTQVAVEYAWRHRQDYQYILWCRADTHEVLVSDYILLARYLDLPEKDANDQMIIVSAVLRWLETHQGWLLILDNADDLTILQGLLPLNHHGHLLLTTRTQALGTLAHSLKVEVDVPRYWGYVTASTSKAD